MQFVDTLEANIFASLKTVANVTITKVTLGSVNVENSVAFTASNGDAATAGQAAFAKLLASPDGVGSVYGTTFGNVAVSNVQQANATNPSEFLLLCNVSLSESQ